MADMVQPLKRWALYVFFAANVPEAEVREGAIQNLLQMLRVGSSDSVAVAAQLHHLGAWAHRYVMPERPPGSGATVLEPVQTIANANTADPDTIVDFFAWAAGACPAKQAMLVVWGHGYGLDDYVPRGARPHPREPAAAASEAQEAASDEQIAITHYKAATLTNTILDQGALEVLPNAQLGAAVQRCAASLPAGQQLAIVALDACTMAMIEVWCEFQNSARIGIASQADVPDSSFPYDRILARLMLQPDAGPTQLAGMVVDAYVESFAWQHNKFVTLSACDLPADKSRADQSPLARLLKSIKQLAVLLTAAAADENARAIIFKARNDSPIFDPDGFMDLGRFCQILQTTLPEVTQACEAVRQDLESFVAYARYSPLDPTLRISQMTGLCVWFPPWLQDASVDIPEKANSIAYLTHGYSETRFAQGTDWDVFLKSMWHNRRHQLAR